MKGSRPAVSSSIALLVVVLIVAAAFYVEIPMVAKSTSTVVTTSSTSQASSSTSSAGGTTGTLRINIAQPLIVAPDQAETVGLTMTALGTVSGTYTFSATSLPSGVNATFSPASVSLPGGLQTPVSMTLTAANGATIANSTMNVVATAGSSVFSSSYSIQSVQALVLIQGNNFHPGSLSVPTGTKVYWIDLDPSSSPDLGPDMHDVTAADNSFSSGGAGSLGQYAIFSHTFTAAGTVQYKSISPSVFTAQIVVTG